MCMVPFCIISSLSIYDVIQSTYDTIISLSYIKGELKAHIHISLYESNTLIE